MPALPYPGGRWTCPLEKQRPNRRRSAAIMNSSSSSNNNNNNNNNYYYYYYHHYYYHHYYYTNIDSCQRPEASSFSHKPTGSGIDGLRSGSPSAGRSWKGCFVMGAKAIGV
ncbi:hypothetical protein LX32DRAFT_643925 [Colletotrichum zoysiae]|uniref:Uncharacterized protein n=1 Tax=Colletotrichum zoysiae TaxID=1216348 RepID=A0AAD9H8D3_9PEZI|nr:hypothetical protein LX32DRAFT_643925 [Colletotrichum zoysiae]